MQDLPAVSLLEASASAHPWKKEHYQDCLNSGYLCRVAERDGEVVAQGVVTVVAREASLLILTVSGEHQGKGYGQAMLRHLIELTSAASDTLFLEVRDSNMKAFNLYLKEGFSEVGRRPNYYPATSNTKAEDAIVMVRDLSLDNESASLP